MRIDEALFAGKPEEALRRQAGQILSAAIDVVDPAAAVGRVVRRHGELLHVDSQTYDLRAVRRLFVIGGGKAAAPMAAALEEILGDRITGGMVNVKYGHALPLRVVEVVEAGHPLPDAAGQRGAERMLRLVGGTGEHDLVICVISGGGSALLPAPVPGLTLEDKIRVTDLLLKSGASIQEINAVRKHLSRIKGGRLAHAAAPAPMVVLMLSDVFGNAPDAIASGPATGDPTTFADALGIVARYGLDDRLPAPPLAYLRRGAAGEAPETPKPDDPVFARVQTVITGSNQFAVQAAAARARVLGFGTIVLAEPLEGEARRAAGSLTARAREVRATPPVTLPACVIAGGETTVTVRGAGRGGRCQEFALAASIEIAEWPRTLVVGFGTDGTDGPTDAAGAMADDATAARARALGLDPQRALDDNDAYAFFSALTDLIMTGPTRTNVNDIYMALIA